MLKSKLFYIILLVFILMLISNNSSADYGILNAISNLSDQVANKFFTLILSLISLLGGESFVDNLISVQNNIPASMHYFLGMFQIGYGMTIILGASLTKFLIRRIPFIG